MANTHWARRVCSLALIMLVLISICGCQQTTVKTERLGMDWSRGQKLGTTDTNDRPAIAVSPGGQDIYLAWIDKPPINEPERLRFARINDTGQLVGERDLPVAIQSPLHVELQITPENNLYLIWIDRTRDGHQLFYTLLDNTGSVLIEPSRLSLAGVSVTSYTTVRSPDGSLDLFWGADGPEHPQLYHLALGSDGRVIAANMAMEQAGLEPAANIDAEGNIHLAWLNEPEYGEYELYYAPFDRSERALDRPVKLATSPVPLGLVAHRPAIGLAGNDVLVFWSLERRGGGLSNPSAHSLYVTFPLGHPEAASAPVDVVIPSENRPEYAQAETLFGVRELASNQGARAASFVYMPTVSQGQAEECAVVFSVELVGRTKSIIQPVLTIWGSGKLQGYQVAAQTSTTSIRNQMVRDDQNALHLVWIDTAGFGAYDIYYTSTAPAIRQAMNRLTSWDVLSAIYSVLWGIVQAFGFFPLAIAWSLLPIMFIAAYLFWQAKGRLDHASARLVLILAIVIYVAIKYLFRPNWLAALPLPRYTPDTIASLVIFITPLVVSALAGLVTWGYVRRTDRAPILAAFGVFVVSDALITLLLYVPAILAE